MPTRPNGIASVGTTRRARRSPKNNTRGKPPTHFKIPISKKNVNNMTNDQLRKYVRRISGRA